MNNSLPTFHRWPFRIHLIENIHESLLGSPSRAAGQPLGLLRAGHGDTFLFKKSISLLVLNLIISLPLQLELILIFIGLVRNFRREIVFLLGFIFYFKASYFMNFLIIMMVQLAKYFATFYLFFLIALALVLENIF